ncbi:iron chaperone [Lapillicoccus jejuensis]|uniref:Uncharacterized protein YdhG (YjbR/CyaY superfamily) n=1 Tax=Lapillicoccus jejuensis TaxID=402171 RepID=A0A542DVK6_9MICO|nr:DUF1801 domain-containing protein [Lapillicoccus jejuensis]TQJ07130.1 uncharacterized protein YdhG (YjbR/CyaY superfamily) [Lapillicoccus jejuensis]
MPGPADVDAYVAALPEPRRTVAEQVRRTVLDAVPGGVETIAYAMPAVAVDGRVPVHWGAWAKHLSLYPVPEALAEETAPYRARKGTLRFPYDDLPLDLVARVAAALAAERTGADVGSGHADPPGA